MSQQNNYKPSLRLPSGGALDWDMTTLTNAQLEYEHHLAYESLYGHTLNGVVMIPGIRSPDYKPPTSFNEETIKEAERVWTLRFERAEQELERRFLLS